MKLQYVANRTAGGWRANGRYLAREGAQREGEKRLGFDASEREVEIDRRLEGWQRAEDPRLWKVILSPERGDALDLVEQLRIVSHRIADRRILRLVRRWLRTGVMEGE